MEKQEYNVCFLDNLERVFEHLPMARHINGEIMKLGPYERSIEIGCAIGGSTQIISKISMETTGIDVDDSRIGIASERFGGIDFRVEDAASLSFEDKSFDAAFLILVLHENPDPKIIEESCRIAKEVVVIDYSFPMSGPWSLFFKILERGKLKRFAAFDFKKVFFQRGFELKEEKVFNRNFYLGIFTQAGKPAD